MVLANPTYIHHILMVVADPIHTLPRASFHTHTHTHTHTHIHTHLLTCKLPETHILS